MSRQDIPLNFLNNRTGALITILMLAVSSISVMATTQVANADQKGDACVIFACGNANITGDTSNSGGGQPTPDTATLIVFKLVECPGSTACPANPSEFKIKVTGNNPSPDTAFTGSSKGTKVTLGPGDFDVDEITGPSGFQVLFSGDCDQNGKGTISSGQTMTCTVANVD